MKKGLINPTIHAIRSANYPSPRYGIPVPKETYAQSIGNMAGTGYNRNSNKLRQLQEDASTIATGARPNPEKNTKRFVGLFGNNAMNEPQKAMTAMENKRRSANQVLRSGIPTPRSVPASLSNKYAMKKSQYGNSFVDSGTVSDMIVAPKKGRHFKGQNEGLSVVSKRQKIKKDAGTPQKLTWWDKTRADRYDAIDQQIAQQKAQEAEAAKQAWIASMQEDNRKNAWWALGIDPATQQPNSYPDLNPQPAPQQQPAPQPVAQSAPAPKRVAQSKPKPVVKQPVVQRVVDTSKMPTWMPPQLMGRGYSTNEVRASTGKALPRGIGLPPQIMGRGAPKSGPNVAFVYQGKIYTPAPQQNTTRTAQSTVSKNPIDVSVATTPASKNPINVTVATRTAQPSATRTAQPSATRTAQPSATRTTQPVKPLRPAPSFWDNLANTSWGQALGFEPAQNGELGKRMKKSAQLSKKKITKHDTGQKHTHNPVPDEGVEDNSFTPWNQKIDYFTKPKPPKPPKVPLGADGYAQGTSNKPSNPSIVGVSGNAKGEEAGGLTDMLNPIEQIKFQFNPSKDVNAIKNIAMVPSYIANRVTGAINQALPYTTPPAKLIPKVAEGAAQAAGHTSGFLDTAGLGFYNAIPGLKNATQWAGNAIDRLATPLITKYPKASASLARVGEKSLPLLRGVGAGVDFALSRVLPATGAAIGAQDVMNATEKESQYKNRTNINPNASSSNLSTSQLPRMIQNTYFDTGTPFLDAMSRGEQDTTASFKPFGVEQLGSIPKNTGYANMVTVPPKASSRTTTGSFPWMRSDFMNSRSMTNLPRQQLEEYGRFGGPVETRVAPNSASSMTNVLNNMAGTLLAPWTQPDELHSSTSTLYSEPRDRLTGRNKNLAWLDEKISTPNEYTAMGENPVTVVSGYGKGKSLNGMNINSDNRVIQGVTQGQNNLKDQSYLFNNIISGAIEAAGVKNTLAQNPNAYKPLSGTSDFVVGNDGKSYRINVPTTLKDKIYDMAGIDSSGNVGVLGDLPGTLITGEPAFFYDGQVASQADVISLYIEDLENPEVPYEEKAQITQYLKNFNEQNQQLYNESLSNSIPTNNMVSNARREMILSRVGDPTGQNMTPFNTSNPNAPSFQYNETGEWGTQNRPNVNAWEPATDTDWYYGVQNTARQPYYVDKTKTPEQAQIEAKKYELNNARNALLGASTTGLNLPYVPYEDNSANLTMPNAKDYLQSIVNPIRTQIQNLGWGAEEAMQDPAGAIQSHPYLTGALGLGALALGAKGGRQYALRNAARSFAPSVDELAHETRALPDMSDEVSRIPARRSMSRNRTVVRPAVASTGSIDDVLRQQNLSKESKIIARFAPNEQLAQIRDNPDKYPELYAKLTENNSMGMSKSMKKSASSVKKSTISYAPNPVPVPVKNLTPKYARPSMPSAPMMTTTTPMIPNHNRNAPVGNSQIKYARDTTMFQKRATKSVVVPSRYDHEEVQPQKYRSSVDATNSKKYE